DHVPGHAFILRRPAQLVALQACSKNRAAVTRCGESPGGIYETPEIPRIDRRCDSSAAARGARAAGGKTADYRVFRRGCVELGSCNPVTVTNAPRQTEANKTSASSRPAP